MELWEKQQIFIICYMKDIGKLLLPFIKSDYLQVSVSSQREHHQNNDIQKIPEEPFHFSAPILYNKQILRIMVMKLWKPCEQKMQKEEQLLAIKFW